MRTMRYKIKIKTCTLYLEMTRDTQDRTTLNRNKNKLFDRKITHKTQHTKLEGKLAKNDDTAIKNPRIRNNQQTDAERHENQIIRNSRQSQYLLDDEWCCFFFTTSSMAYTYQNRKGSTSAAVYFMSRIEARGDHIGHGVS